MIRDVPAERCGALPGRHVAAVTIRVRCRESIVVPHVAIGAGHDLSHRCHLMRTRQRPARRVVIEDRRIPSDRVVAGRTVRRRERRAGLWVHRVIRCLPRRQVASPIAAVGRGYIQAVVVADVAGSAGRHLAAIGHQRVRVRQREPERGVIELAVGPLGDGVALGASSGRRGEARLDVIRHTAAERRRGVPRRLVAAHTVSRVQCVIVADVAGSAGRGRRRSMRARQRETGGAVVERSGVPAFRGMASRAIRRRKSGSRCRVYRCGGLLPSRQMASGVAAVRRRNRQSVVVVDMARSAGHVGVPVGQQEARGAVIEDRRGPGNGVVASRAVGHAKSRARRRVHWIIRLLPSRQMASRISAVRLHNM